MEIDDSLYRRVCYAGTSSPGAVFVSQRNKTCLTHKGNGQSLIVRVISLLRSNPSRFPGLIRHSASPPSSRQRYVLGDNAMHQMAQSSVFLSGMGALGIEIGTPQIQNVTLHLWHVSYVYSRCEFDIERLTFVFYSKEYRSRRCEGIQRKHFVRTF